jgi:hypothetical protein
MEPTTLFPIISILLLIGVEWGGWALLGFLTEQEPPSGFKLGFFRTGHSHAGELLVLSLVYYLYLPRADYSSAVEWTVGVVLTVGTLLLSGGFFMHVFIGRERTPSRGTTLTRVGTVLIAAALIVLAVGLIKTA